MAYSASPAAPQPRRRRILPFVIVAVVAVVVIAAVRWVATGANPPSLFGCGDESVSLTVAASPEKAGLMARFAEDYSGTRIDAGCVEVSVVEQSSGATLDALNEGTWDEAEYGPRPDVWSPAGSGWVQMARDAAVEADNAALIPEETPSIANSPLVIAMPRPMAEALGWPQESLGWSDLVELSESEEGWAAHGHPEWGDFRMGKTNPNYSTSGLNATIGSYFAATGLTSDLTSANIEDSETRAFVSGVERSIVHYGDITMTFLSNLQRADAEGRGMSYISAVAVEEMSVVHYNQGNPTGDPGTTGQSEPPSVPLAAIYPDEGTLMSDHPYVVLDWAEDPQQAAAAGFLEYLLDEEAQEAFTDNAFRDHEGATGELLSEANGVLSDQPAQLLTPPSSGVLGEMLANWAELRKPANVLLVIDTSGSMEEPVAGTGQSKLELAKAAATTSLGQFSDTDSVGLWMFSTELEGTQDWRELVPLGPLDEQVNGQARRDDLVERVDGLPPGGGTGLYDTALDAHDLVLDNSRDDAINAVVILTDGRNEDRNSIPLDDLTGQISTESGQRGVRIFTIGYGADADLETMETIAEATNAAAYDSSDPESIDEIFEAVISNF